MTKDEWVKDAKEWGNALNDAGWEFIETYKDVLPPKVFNCLKTCLRAAIIKYADRVAEEDS